MGRDGLDQSDGYGTCQGTVCWGRQSKQASVMGTCEAGESRCLFLPAPCGGWIP